MPKYDYSMPLDDSDIIALEKNYVTFTELANILNVSRQHLTKSTHLNIKVTTIFGIYIVPKSEVTRLLELKKQKQEQIKKNKAKFSKPKQGKQIVTTQQLRLQAKELKLRVSNLSKSQLAQAIKHRKERQAVNDAIGKDFEYIVSHSYNFTITELTEALQDFTVSEIERHMYELGYDPPKGKFKSQVIKSTINQIGAGHV